MEFNAQRPPAISDKQVVEVEPSPAVLSYDDGGGGGVYMCVHVGVGGEKSSFFTILLRCVSAAGIGKSITDECGRRVCKAFEIFFLTLHYREHFIS